MTCDICGKSFTKGYNGRTVNICSPLCGKAYYLKTYLNRLEERRGKDEASNPITYQQARELAAWLSVYVYGNDDAQKRAGRIIKEFVRQEWEGA